MDHPFYVYQLSKCYPPFMNIDPGGVDGQTPETLWGGHLVSDSVDVSGPGRKTVYDPCPYGYRVPTTTQIYQDLNPSSIITSNIYSTLVESDVCDTQAKVIRNNDHLVFLPAAGNGTINALGNASFCAINNPGFQGVYNSSDIVWLPEKGHYRYYTLYLYLRFFTDYAIGFDTFNSVRCVKE